MAQIYNHLGHIIAAGNPFYYIWQFALMGLLLAASAFFSGAETAFFNLSRRQINQLQKSAHKLQRLTYKLLSQPGELLSCFLFGNMTVNVLFFAAASILAFRIEGQFGVTAAAVAGFIGFASLVIFGEVLPKSLAYANSKAICIAASLPALVFLEIFTPIITVFRVLLVEPALRLIPGPAKRPRAITTGEFKMLIEAVQKRGLITAYENTLLSEILQLGFLKARHIMRPRVDMIACNVEDSNRSIREVMQKHHLTKLPIYSKTMDNMVGMVSFRRLLLSPNSPIDKLIEKVDFVPEQKTVESLLEFFRSSGADTAIVVDEYGGIAGSICLEDIAEELLGPIGSTDQVEPIKQIGPFEYRLAGNLAIHDWAEVFNIDPQQTKVSTIAGMVTAILGKISKPGDVAHLRNIKFTVDQVRKNRIESIILTLEPITTDDK